MQLSDSLHSRVQEMNADITIREAVADDGAAFIRMMNKYYRRKKDNSYFQWQFFTASPVSRLFVALHGEELVGCYGVQLLLLNNGSACGFTVDLLIEDEYRKRGVFVLLEHAVTSFLISRNAVGLVSLPNPDGRNAHVWIQGWKELGKIRTLLFSSEAVIGDTPPKAERNDIVFFAKSPGYRRWRFDENPLYQYSRVTADRDSFAVVKIFVDPATNVSLGDIVDIECDLHDAAAIRQVLRSACEYLKGRGVREVTVWGLPHTSTGSVARSLGFRESSQERFFCVKVLQPGHEYLYDFSRWHLVEADSEIY